jgi:hypothetical protein
LVIVRSFVTHSALKYVTIRPLFIFIEHSMDWDIQRTVFEPNGKTT